MGTQPPTPPRVSWKSAQGSEAAGGDGTWTAVRGGGGPLMWGQTPGAEVPSSTQRLEEGGPGRSAVAVEEAAARRGRWARRPQPGRTVVIAGGCCLAGGQCLGAAGQGQRSGPGQKRVEEEGDTRLP